MNLISRFFGLFKPKPKSKAVDFKIVLVPSDPRHLPSVEMNEQINMTLEKIKIAKDRVVEHIESLLAKKEAIYRKMVLESKSKEDQDTLMEIERELAYVRERIQSIKEGRSSADINIQRYLNVTSMLKDNI